jgi:hypothetical protein
MNSESNPKNSNLEEPWHPHKENLKRTFIEGFSVNGDSRGVGHKACRVLTSNYGNECSQFTLVSNLSMNNCAHNQDEHPTAARPHVIFVPGGYKIIGPAITRQR